MSCSDQTTSLLADSKTQEEGAENIPEVANNSKIFKDQF
jgi:hypothetical protein